MKALIDQYGRVIDSCRISLTDLCNFSCHYCVPEEGYLLASNESCLSKDEVIRLVSILVSLGISKIRLTGGEPLLRKDLVEIIIELKAIEGLTDLAMTTNGSLLERKLEKLKAAGLDRLNISLDSMDPDRFEAITKTQTFYKVLKATHAALRLGFPVKLNMVVQAGLTENEIIEYVNLAHEYPLEVRFLEFMPLCGTSWSAEKVLPIQEVRSIVRNNFSLLAEDIRGSTVAQTFALKKGKGKVGFIASLTESFCGDCSRIRVTADGNIRSCLFADQEFPIKHLLKESVTDQEIIGLIQEAVFQKPAGNQFRDKPFIKNEFVTKRELVTTGAMIRKSGG